MKISTLFERLCILCGAHSRILLCHACQQDIITDTPRCPVCARENMHYLVCQQCRTKSPLIRQTQVLFTYQYPAKILIHAFKFNKQYGMAKTFAALMKEKLDLDKIKSAILVPVPIHQSRLRQRGYNQSFELAKALGRQMKIKIDLTACIKNKNTPPQSTLTPEERMENVKDCFFLTHKIAAKHIIIVDDVITTGATVNELAKTIKQDNDQCIDVWAIAKA